MKDYKTYSSIIDANKDKMEYLNSILSDLELVSKSLFESIGEISDLKNQYKILREQYPNIPSKILQNFVRLYNTKKDIKRPLKAGIYLDQNFNVQFKESSFCNVWLRFSEINFPVFGKHITEKIEDPNLIKQVHIYKNKNRIHCRLIVEREIDDTKLNPLSDKSDSLSRLIVEEKTLDKFPKLNGRRIYRGKNFRRIKDFTQKMTSEISSKLHMRGVEVLQIEDEKNLYESLIVSAPFEKKYVLKYFPLKEFIRTLINKCLSNGIAYRYCI